jgi:hypothetical protein
VISKKDGEVGQGYRKQIRQRCPLLGVKQTLRKPSRMSASKDGRGTAGMVCLSEGKAATLFNLTSLSRWGDRARICPEIR